MFIQKKNKTEYKHMCRYMNINVCMNMYNIKYNNKKVNDNKAANKTKINKNYLTKK